MVPALIADTPDFDSPIDAPHPSVPEEFNIVQDHTKPGGMRGMLLLNAALLALLAAVVFGSSAGAQNPARGRGEYTMVTGGANGTNAGVVYIADVANQEMIAMLYNYNTKVMDGVGYRNLAADAAGIRNRPRPAN